MRILAIIFCGAIAATAALPAAANPFEQGFRPFVQGQGQLPAPQRGAEQFAPQRDARGSAEGDRGRMSPDERRQLRRDIQDAGKDIYPPARPVNDPRRSGRR